MSWLRQPTRLLVHASRTHACKAIGSGTNMACATELRAMQWPCARHDGVSDLARCTLTRSFAAQTTGATAASSSPATARAAGMAPRRAPGKKFRWSGMLLAVPSAIAAYLGTWQLRRRESKIEALEERQARMAAEPLDLFAEEYLPPEYTRVRLQGTFDYSKDALVGPRGRPSAGMTVTSYLVVTPLTSLDGKRTVLVNRGWVPLSWKDDKEARKIGEPAGPVTVTGILRSGEQAGQFVPRNNIQSCTWHFINTAELADAANLHPDTPLVEAVISDDEAALMAAKPPSVMEVLGGKGMGRAAIPDVIPLPKTMGELRRFSVMPDDHRNYAATWFTLSAATGALAVKAMRQAAK